MKYWLNGEIFSKTRAIDSRDRGFLLGDGVFETMLARNGAPAILDRHLDRLAGALDELKIGARAPDNVEEILAALAEANRLSSGEAAARITVTRGVGARGLRFPSQDDARATVLITLAPAPAYSNGDGPLVLHESIYRRAEASIGARLKTLGYLDNIMADNEARAQGGDAALMMNGAGRPACASQANIFVIEPGRVVTPPVGEGALPGVVRALLLDEAGASLGLDIVEAPLERADLKGAAVFLTNSLMGLRPAHLAGADVAWGAAEREILHALQSWYEQRLQNDLAERTARRP